MRSYLIPLFGVIMLMFLNAQANDLLVQKKSSVLFSTLGRLNDSTMSTPKQSSRPEYFEVRQNYPNPFNATTTIEYDLPEEAGVYAVVYDILGHRVKTLKNDLQKAGRHKLEWDGIANNGDEVASGVYFYVLLADENYSIGKMLLLK